MKKRAICLLSGLAASVAPLSASAQWDSGITKAEESNLPKGTILNIITNLMKWLLILLGIFAVIGFVISGIWYLTSAGDEERMERGKRGMMYSIIGVIVGLLGLVVIFAVNKWLGGSTTDF